MILVIRMIEFFGSCRLRTVSSLPVALVFLISGFNASVIADESKNTSVIDFWVKPKRCVSNYKGQTCEKQLRLGWKVGGAEQYCLFRSTEKEALICWNSQSSTSYRTKFKSNRNEVFQIRLKENDQVVAEVEVIVEWVYRAGKNNNRGWRLF